MRTAFVTYAPAVLALIGAVLLRTLLDPVMGDALPLVTLFGAVAAAVWFGGYRPALLVTIVGYFVCAYLFLAPRGHILPDDLGRVVGLTAHLFTCALIIGFGEAARVSQARINAGREVLRVTLRSIGDAVVTTDTKGSVTYLNAVAESLTGWTQGDAVGRSLQEVFRIVNETTRQPVDNPAMKALRDGIVVGLANHTVLIARDGTEHPIDDSAAPIRGENGRISGCVLIFRDVSAQRRIERERAEQLLTARRLASIVDTSDDAIVGKTLDGTIQSWNAAAERVFGHPAAQAIGRHISLVIPPERLAEEDAIVARLKRGERIDHFETERLRADGGRILVSLTISPIMNAAGDVVGASKIARDVTQQRRVEQRERQLLAEALEANAKFQAFFDQGAVFAGIMDIDGTIVEPNRLSWEGCGYTREQSVGMPFWEGPWWAPSPALVEQIKAASAQAAAGETFRGELPYFVAGGIERIVDLTIQPITDDTGRVLFLAPTGTDITDRKRAEADRERFVTVIENSTDFIGICDLDGVPFFINRAGLAMVGLEVERAHTTPVREFFFPEDQAKVVDEFFPSVLETGHGEIEIRFRHFQTGAARWMAYKVLTLPDAAGRPTAIATVSQDVTERKRLEDDLRGLAADLSEADRRKDEFLAVLAHELRNPLAPISNAVQVLRLRADDSDAVRSASEMLERQVVQMTRLVDDLLDVSRITRGRIELRRERVEIAPIVSQAVEATQALYRRVEQELTVTLPSEPILLDADPTRLAQVVGNLLNNACKFTDRGGHIWLSVERDGGEAVVRVRDTGVGIAAEHLPKLFKMFTQIESSLERSRDGLGIGLALVKVLVEMHGGTVDAHSAGVGRGSEFVVRLPIPGGADSTQAGTTAGEPRATTGHRILIVDDNQDGAESLAMLLSFSGHETHVVHDGQEALTAAERLRPDVMLLDIGLPTLNGYEVCRRVRAQPWGKDMLLIAITGWGQNEDRRRSREAGFSAHLIKPVDPDALLKLFESGDRPQR